MSRTYKILIWIAALPVIVACGWPIVRNVLWPIVYEGSALIAGWFGPAVTARPWLSIGIALWVAVVAVVTLVMSRRKGK